MNRNDVILVAIAGVVLLAGVQYNRWSEARQARADAAAVEASKRAAAERLPLLWQSQGPAVMARAREEMRAERYQAVLDVLEPWAVVLSPEERGFRNAAARLLEQQQAQAKPLQEAAAWRPVRSQWDGTYRLAVDWVDRNVAGDAQIEFKQCTPAVLVSGKWKTTCRWERRTPLGLRFDESLTFLMVDGEVVETF